MQDGEAGVAARLGHGLVELFPRRSSARLLSSGGARLAGQLAQQAGVLAQLADVLLCGRVPTHELLGAQADVQQTRLLQDPHGVEEAAGAAGAGCAGGAGAAWKPFDRSQGRRRGGGDGGRAG